MMKISQDEYHSDDGAISLKREFGVTPNGNPMAGRWALRSAGKLVDFDTYQNDLAERHALRLH